METRGHVSYNTCAQFLCALKFSYVYAAEPFLVVKQCGGISSASLYLL